MDICLLCLEQRSSPDKGIQVESSQWQDENLDKIIKQHFWPLKTLTLKSWLCSNCWRILHEFHKFHAGIEKAHSCLSMIHELSMVQDPTGIEKAHFCLSKVKTENSPIDECEDQEFVNCDVFNPVNTPQLEPQNELDIPNVSTPENEHVFINKELDNEPAATEPEIIIPEISLSPVSNTTNDPLQKLPRDLENSKISSKQESSLLHKQKKRKLILEKNANDGAALHADTSTESKEEAELKSRLYQEEQNKFVSENYTIKCGICQREMETFADVRIHSGRDHQQSGFVVCCNKKIFRRSDLVEHLKWHLDPEYLKCKTCLKVFDKLRSLENHERRHEDVELSESRVHHEEQNKFISENYTIKCGICQSEMNTFQDVQRHCATYHQQSGFVVCCYKKIFRRSDLVDHLKWHLDPEYLKCKTCEKRFKNLRVLAKHEEMHVDAEYACDVCGKVFPRIWALKNHKLFHSNTSCDICGLKVASTKSLGLHKFKMHPESGQKEFKCRLCSKVYTNVLELKTHITNHENVLNFKCTRCENAYKTAFQLKEHLASHTGYVCPHCPKIFEYNSSMRKHWKKQHPKMLEDASSSKING